jgi:hypothetical protein
MTALCSSTRCPHPLPSDFTNTRHCLPYPLLSCRRFCTHRLVFLRQLSVEVHSLSLLGSQGRGRRGTQMASEMRAMTDFGLRWGGAARNKAPKF